MGISHFKTDPQADFTGTVTIYNSDGITGTVNATDMVRPSDWNSAHQVIFNLSGNTAGSSQITGSDVILMGGANITLSADTANSKLQIIGGAGAGGGIAAAAGTQTATSGTIVFANSNGITAGMSASSQITFSHNGITSQTVQTQNMVSVLGSTGNISFANGNGITFGANASTITASHNGLTTARASNDGVGLNTAQTNVTWTVNSNGISLNAGAYLTTAMQSQSSSVFAKTGFTSTTTAGTAIVGTHDTNGLSIGVPQFLTTAARSQDSSNYAGLGTTFNGANISGSMTMNTAGLQLSMSVAAPGGGGAAISAGANSTNAGTVVFSNSNGVSFGMDGAGVITATVVPGAAAGIAAVQAGAQTQTSGTLVFANSNGLTFGLSGSSQLTASYSVPASSSLVGVSGVSISTNGSTISFMANPVTYLTYQNRQLGASGSTQMTNNQIWMVPFRIAGGSVSASTIQYIQSLSGTFTSAVAATHAQTMKWAIYSQDTGNATVFNSASSGSITWQVWNSGTSSGSYAFQGNTSSSAGTGILTQAAGVRMIDIPFGSTIGPGLYIMALAPSSSSAGYSGLFSRYGVVVDSPMPLAMGAGFGSATATSIGYGDAGTYGTTSTAFPSVVTLSQIKQHSNLVPYFKMGAV